MGNEALYHPVQTMQKHECSKDIIVGHALLKTMKLLKISLWTSTDATPPSLVPDYYSPYPNM